MPGQSGTGTRIPFEGRGYPYAELTAESWSLGMIPHLWRVLPG
ncbi:hypothetical protein [Corallococcus sp. AB018]|nr:hypothetical protein [Corallococcus sp. AB018]